MTKEGGVQIQVVSDRLHRQLALPLKFIKIVCVTLLLGDEAIVFYATNSPSYCVTIMLANTGCLVRLKEIESGFYI